MEFVPDDDGIRLVRRERRIEAAFGILKADVAVTDEEMQQVIRRWASK